MPARSNIYAGVAGYVGRPDQQGKVGVFRRSAEGGDWEHVLPQHECHAVCVHPTEPDVVLAGTAGGGGRSRAPGAPCAFGPRVMRMAQNPRRPEEIYAALEINGVVRTLDGGETWSDCSDDLVRLAERPHLKSKIASNTFAEGMLDGHAIAISPADPDAVILAGATSGCRRR